MALAALTAGHERLQLVGDPDTLVTGIQYDSRLVVPGDLFVALSGAYCDGHAFIPDALKRGAAAVLVERVGSEPTPAIVAPDTRAWLPEVAARYYDQPSLELAVIGVTGTDGKTTVCYLVDAILRDAGHTTGMVGTVSVRIAGHVVDHETRQTTPESADIQRYLRDMADAGVDWAILESTSHGLDLHRLDQVRFSIGAVTNVTHEHLEHHKSLDAYRRAKGKLFERVAEVGGVCVINLDDEGAREMRRYVGSSRVMTYSMTDASAEFFADDIDLGVTGSTFRVITDVGTAGIQLPLVGRFNVANALCAVGVARAAGVRLDQIVQSLQEAVPVPGRMARIDEGQPFSVIVDYAHTPESLDKVLSLLRDLNPLGRLIAVSGSAGERDTTKRPLQGAVSARLADVSIFTTEDPRFEDADKIIEEIATGAAGTGAERGRHYHCITDRRQAIQYALSIAREQDCVVLAGKGHERSIIWGQDKRPWDEAAVARELLQELGYGNG